MVKATISDKELTGYTDEKGFVELGPISDGEVGTVEIDGYENLEKEFTFANALDFVTLEMTPTVSKFLWNFLIFIILTYSKIIICYSGITNWIQIFISWIWPLRI